VTIEPSTLTVKAGATRTVAVTVSFSKADVAALPGASSSDRGKLTSLRGVVTAKPKGSHTGIVGLRTAFVAVPVPLSAVKASTTVSPTASGYSGIKVTNSGVHTGTADVYQRLLSDPAGDADSPDAPDLTDVGVQALLPPDGSTADRMLVFAVAQAKGTSSQGVHEVDLLLDTDGDGQTDYTTFVADTGSILDGEADGTMSAFTITPSGDLVDQQPASAPANGSTLLVPVLASSLEITPASPPLRVGAIGFSATGDNGWDPVDGTGRFDPFSPALSQGQLVTVKPGRSVTIPTRVDESELGRQTGTGWLVVSPDDAAGRGEAGRVELQARDQQTQSLLASTR